MLLLHPAAVRCVTAASRRQSHWHQCYVPSASHDSSQQVTNSIRRCALPASYGTGLAQHYRIVSTTTLYITTLSQHQSRILRNRPSWRHCRSERDSTPLTNTCQTAVELKFTNHIRHHRVSILLRQQVKTTYPTTPQFSSIRPSSRTDSLQSRSVAQP